MRRDGPQGIFGRAMDVHVLKTGTRHHQMLLGKREPEHRNTSGAEKDANDAVAEDVNSLRPCFI